MSRIPPSARFVAVRGLRSAPVIARASGRCVWAVRVFAKGTCASPAPACLFVPFSSAVRAHAFARAVVVRLGWRVWVPGHQAFGPLFSAVGLPVPPVCVKVALPCSISAARPLLRACMEVA